MNKYFITKKGLLLAYIMAVPFMAFTSAFFCKSMGPLLDEAVLRPGKAALNAIYFFLLMGALDLLASYLQKIVREKMRTSFLIGLKRDVFSGIMKMGFEKFREQSPATYISMMQRDVRKISTDYFDSVCGIYRVLTCFAITLVILIGINPWICALNVAISFVSVFIPQLLGKKIEAASDKASKSSADYQGVVSDALSGFNTIKIFSVTNQITKVIEKRNVQNEKSEYESVKINYQSSYLSIIFSQLGFMSTMAIGAVLVLNGKMTVGSVVAISQLIGGILAPFEELPMFLANLKSIKVVKDKLEAVIHENDVIEAETKDICYNDYNLVCDNLCVAYDGKTALQNVSVNFEENKKYLLLGESGCGKSTLAKAIMGMVKKDDGRILLGNCNTEDMSVEQLCKAVNYMQQEVFLFDDTLWNNITLYQDYSKEEVIKVINRAGLDEYVNSLEDGLDTKINGNGYNLSGGQKQRIGIARSLLSGARILVFDEMTSNLDVVLEKQIEETILGLENVTVIMITHSMNKETLKGADGIVVLKHGKIYEKGTYEELMGQKGLLYGYSIIAE